MFLDCILFFGLLYISWYNVQLVCCDFMNKVVFSKCYLSLHISFILYIFLSVFYFQSYRWGDLLMLLEIKLVIIIYCEICSILYYFSFLIGTCSFTQSQEQFGITSVPSPFLFAIIYNTSIIAFPIKSSLTTLNWLISVGNTNSRRKR